MKLATSPPVSAMTFALDDWAVSSGEAKSEPVMGNRRHAEDLGVRAGGEAGDVALDRVAERGVLRHHRYQVSNPLPISPEPITFAWV